MMPSKAVLKRDTDRKNDRSAVIVIDQDGNELARIHGAMSLTAAGLLIAWVNKDLRAIINPIGYAVEAEIK